MIESIIIIGLNGYKIYIGLQCGDGQQHLTVILKWLYRESQNKHCCNDTTNLVNFWIYMVPCCPRIVKARDLNAECFNQDSM